MDEVELAQKNQKVFQQNLMREQEEFLERDIEESRARDLEEGQRAQKRLTEEDQSQNERQNIIQQINQEDYIQDQQIQQQIQQDQRLAQGGDFEGNAIGGDGLNEQSVEEAKDVLKEGGHSLSSEEVTELASNKPQKESFPVIILCFVIIKDVFDIVVDLSLVLIVLGFIYIPIYFVIILNWNLGRLNKLGRMKRFILKKVMNRFIAGQIVEAIPFVNALPFATVFFFLNYYEHTKFVQLLIRAADIAIKL